MARTLGGIILMARTLGAIILMARIFLKEDDRNCTLFTLPTVAKQALDSIFCAAFSSLQYNKEEERKPYLMALFAQSVAFGVQGLPCLELLLAYYANSNP